MAAPAIAQHLIGRARQLMAQLRVFTGPEPVRFTFLASSEATEIDYLSPARDGELARVFADGPFRYVAPGDTRTANVVILSAHGRDHSVPIWELRGRLREDAIVAVWFWDNHLGQLNNLRTALAADFVFPSHAYAAQYLFNPVSVLAGPCAACCAQWTRTEAREVLAAQAGAPRIHKAFLNYVDYGFSWRSALLRELATRSSVDALLMPADDRSRYFRKPRRERLLEWLRYKATVILPVDKDLSTRAFDALLAGQVPVVPTLVRDFDRVIPPPVQAELGIVRVEETTAAAVEAAIAEALQRFDRMGEEGVAKRQQFALGQHMLPNRLAEMMETLAAVARREVIVPEVRKPGFGLYLRERPAAPAG